MKRDPAAIGQDILAALGLLTDRLDTLYNALSLSDLYQPVPALLSGAIEEKRGLLGAVAVHQRIQQPNPSPPPPGD